MIEVTGDIHGDFNRFKHPSLKKLKKKDALLICGDFGFIWRGTKKEKRILKKIGKKRYDVLFVEGIHENYSLLEEYPIEEWCGGKTRLISGNLRQLMRGQVYEIAGKKVFTFGGGFRETEEKGISNASIWEDKEVPNEEEINQALENLERVGNKVDYIITHEPPTLINEFIEIGTNHTSYISSFFDGLRESVEFEKWFFGKLHINKLVPPKYYGVFNDVIIADKTRIKHKKEKKNGRI